MHALVAIVTLAALVLYLLFGLQVAKARRATGIAAPAMTGAPELERAIRVQMNTLEWMPLFLVPLWLTAYYWLDIVAAILGVVWIGGRFYYSMLYMRDPGSRSAGFLIQAAACGLLWLCALFGALRALF